MGRLAIGALVVGASGCAQLLGIDGTTGAAGSDAAPPEVSLRVQRMSIGTTVVVAPQDVTGQHASYEVADPAAPSGLLAVPAVQAAIDTWTAPIATGTPAVEFTLPDYPHPVTRVYALPARALVGLFAQLEHPGATPAPAGAMLGVAIALDAPYTGAETYDLLTIGSWTARGLPAPSQDPTQLVAAVPFDEPGVSISGRPVDKIIAADAVLVLRYVGNQLTGLFHAPPFDQTGNDPITGMMEPVTPDLTLAMTIHPADVAARYLNVRPALDPPGMAYYLHAAPGYTVGNTTGPQLDAIPVADTDDGNVSLAYANPFAGAGWHAVVTWSTGASRTYTVNSMTATLTAAINQVAEPGPGLDLALPAGLPTSISIAQTPLLTDGMTVTVDPTKAVELEFVPDRTGATVCQMQLFELVPDASGTALVYQQRLSVLGVEPRFVVPADAFVPGHLYTLRAVTVVGGYPALASGDLTMRSLPLTGAYADSGVFTVRSP